MTKRQFSFLTLLVLAFIVAACSLPDRIPDLRRIKIPIPDVLKPRPTVTYTLQPGAPDITQVVVTKVPDQAQPPASTVVQESTGVVAIQAAVVGDQVIYQDELAEGWSNWSWDATTDPESTDPVYSGSAAFSAEINKGWAAVFLHTDNPISTSRYTAVHFWIHGGSQGGQSIAFKVIDGYNKNWENLAVLTLTAGEWTEVTIPLERLGSPEDMGGLVWQENTGAAASTFSIDGVTLVARTGMLTTPLSPIAGPALIIDAQAAMRPISPYIYGMNFADKELAAELRLPVRRWGGNATTLYNYQLDVHNTGSDWYFENIPEENPNPELLPDGSSVDRTIDQDLQTGTKSLITIPLIGWTPKRRVDAHPYDCSYKVSKYGAQESVDTWDTDCGNGKDAQGNNLTGNDPNDAYQPITPEFIQDWVKHLVQKYGSAEEGGVLFYNLDNEPMLWPYTHRDVHPEMTTYDEVRDRTFAYASALKQADPTAQTLGPVSWGWCGYLYSAIDECQPGKDFRAHSSTYFVEWYLQQMAAYEKAHGVRLLDYLDLHIYPQAQGVSGDAQGDLTMQELRLRSTRSLWDTGYTDESWINKEIALIPRMREWVDKNYPGTKLAITEYSWGGKGSLNGALAQADILGIFGREGLDLATLWNPPLAEEPAAFAFRMFRNYDGTGGAFGDTSLSASSADQDKLAVYAARRESDGALTLMIINKTRKDLTSDVTIKNSLLAGSAQVYQYSGDHPDKIAHQPDLLLTANGLSITFPAQSITLVVIAR